MQHLWRPYTQMATAAPALPVARTDGTRLHLADGRVLLDGIASWWTACHGYNHPHIRDAVAAQLARMPHVMFGGLTHEPAERLAARLAALLPRPLDHVFFSDSGSVAVEVALKMAVQACRNRDEPGRTRIVGFRGGYHGDTLGAMAVCDPDEGLHARFGDYVPQQIVADLPDTSEKSAALDALLTTHGRSIAALIVEPLVQGAGGMRFHAPAVLATIADAARRHDILLIADEVFTGFGRTGSMFACEAAAVVPDIVCLSKALTGGTMALAATVASRDVFEAFLGDDPAKALMHGPTFMANPLACAAANASLDLFETEPRVAQAQAMEAALQAGLAPCRELPGVVDVRTGGAIGVVQMDAPVDRARLAAALVDAGVWVRPFGDIVYLTPALNMRAAEVAQLCEAIGRVLAA